MEALEQNPSWSASAPVLADLEPDDEWKQRLKTNIEAGLRSMFDEAKQNLSDRLAKGVIGPEERERLTADHLATLKALRQLAEEQFRVALERERQERRWASGEQLDRAWSETMMKEQQAILDRIEREKNKTPATSPRPDSRRPPPLLPPPLSRFQFSPKSHVPPTETSVPTLSASNRKPERITRHSQTVDPKQDERAPSFRPVHNIPTDVRPITQEFWKPSITPEEDAQMSRTFKLAKPSNASSSIRPSSIVSVAFTDPLDALSANADRERSRSGTVIARSSVVTPSVISATITDPFDALSATTYGKQSSVDSSNQGRSSLDRAREKDEKPGYDHLVHSGDQRLEDRIGHSRLSTVSPNSLAYSRPGDSSRLRMPPPSAMRSIVNRESLTNEEDEAGWGPGFGGKEEEVNRKTREPTMREEEVKKKEREVLLKEEEVKQKEEEVRSRELEVRRKEEGVVKKEQEVNSREILIRQKEEETRKKEEQLRKREGELRRREADLSRREAEMGRKEGKLLVEFQERGKTHH